MSRHATTRANPPADYPLLIMLKHYALLPLKERITQLEKHGYTIYHEPIQPDNEPKEFIVYDTRDLERQMMEEANAKRKGDYTKSRFVAMSKIFANPARRPRLKERMGLGDVETRLQAAITRDRLQSRGLRWEGDIVLR